MHVFKNADFISCEDENRTFKYLVEKDGKIIFTGDQLPDVYSQFETVDLKKRCVANCPLLEVALPLPWMVASVPNKPR
jgi:predicted amidohydrolase YtcJ